MIPVAKALVTAAILWFVAQGTDLSAAGLGVEAISPGWIALAFGLFIAQVIMNSWRWCLLAPLDEGKITFNDAFRIYLEGAFFNQVLPTSLGGDIVRIYRVTKLGNRPGQAINGVLLDRLAGTVGLLILMIAGLVPFYTVVTDPPARLGFTTVPALAVLGLLLLLVVGSLGERCRFRFGDSFVRFALLVRRMLVRPSTALPALGLAITGHLAMVTGTWALARSLGIGADWLACLTIVPGAILISMVPISVAGWGVREGAMVAGFALIGIGAEPSLVLSVAVGLMLLAIGLLGGCIWMLNDTGKLRHPAALVTNRAGGPQTDGI